ncbi:MAG: DUF4221 family protein [Cyclobacteriaceae bacterium]|nr:DUF4221 family protein [Cyclobacteriaceae bacterium]
MGVITRLIVLIAFISLSCSKQYPESETGENIYGQQIYDLHAVDTVFIPVDSTVSTFYPIFQYYEHQDSCWFVVYNSIDHTIRFFNIKTKYEERSITLDLDGPKTIPELQGLLVHNLDSIFLFSLITNDIFLINKNGSIHDSFVVNEKIIDGPNGYEIQVGDFFNPSFDYPLLTFWIAPLIERTQPEYYKYQIAVDFDVNERKIARNYGNYPKAYSEGFTYFLLEDAGRLQSVDYDIHYFLGSHKLFLHNKQDKSLAKEVFAKSIYLPEKISASMKKRGVEPERQQQANYYIQTGRYSVIRYDSHNGLYYRFVRHPQELKEPSGLLNGKIDSKYSIMILDSTFAVVGEYVLSAKQFLEITSFVSQGLLWISANHPKNSINHEDHLVFIRFKPVLK